MISPGGENVLRKQRLRNRGQVTFLAFTVPALLIYIVFYAAPVFMGIFYSMTDWNGITPNYKFIGLDNYVKVFQDKYFIDAIAFTLKYTLLVTVGIVGLSLILALALNQVKRFRSLVRAVYFFPAVLSLVTVGLIFNEIYYQVLPEIGKALGIEALSKNILSDPDTAIYGIVFINLWQGVALPSLLILAGLQSVPAELQEAATLDGANAVQRFWKVTFPFLIPSMNIVIINAVKSGILVYDYIMATTGGGPGHATKSINQIIIENAFGGKLAFSYAISQSVVLFVILAALSFIQFKIMNRKEVA